MSVYAMEWVLDHSETMGTTRLVLIAIARHASHAGHDAFMSQRTLAREAGVSDRTVRRAIEECVLLDELTVHEYGGPPVTGVNGGRRTHRYSLHKYADSLTGNAREVAGQSDKVAGQNEGGLPDTGVQGIVLNRPSESSAAIASKNEELAARMVDHFGRRFSGECVSIVDAALRIHDWRAVDVHIGKAIEAGAQYPSWVAKAVGVPCGREARLRVPA